MSWARILTCLNISERTLKAFANNSEMSRLTFLTFYIGKASWLTGPRNGVLVSNTTASPIGPPTIGRRHKSLTMHALLFFMASATPPMHSLENATENSGSSSLHFGWANIGKNKKRRSTERLFCLSCLRFRCKTPPRFRNVSRLRAPEPQPHHPLLCQ